MGDRFVANVQYHDLVGTAAFDGHDGPPLNELAKRSKLPDGYYPVGFELFRLDPDENGQIPFTVVAARCADTGRTIDELIQFAREHNEVPVHRFRGTIDPKHFSNVFKRIAIKAIASDLSKCNVVVTTPNDVT